VGRSAKTATVQAFDLDGRALGPSITFRDPARGRSSVAGLDVDADRRVWVADEAARKLRGFTLFGRPIAELGGTDEDLLDVRGALGVPVAVRARGSDEELVLLVASAGRRRYALQLHRPHDARVRTLTSLGDPEGTYDDLVHLDWTTRATSAGEEELIVTCERRAARVQVFRDGRFHYAFDVKGGAGGRARPAAAVRLTDGRLVVALGDEEGRGGALLLLRADGRVLRTLAGPGEVSQPSGLAALAGEDDGATRVWVLDREGLRVQLFTLDGRGWGEFPSLVRGG